ncbi:transposase domain-containing protein [Streptomyces sp. NBC_01550]|uniref:transposase domain-containing protein n=1 Tax=Streptomyces sp. NBC_01550 TaxID=2975875 RepID=UPI00386EFD6D
MPVELVAPGQPFGEHVRLGVLTEEITPRLVDEVVEHSGRTECRRRLLPARTVVYFVLALCLFSSSDSAGPPGYRWVLRTLAEKLRHLPGVCVQRLPTSSALTRARQRLGAKPLQILFERRCGTLATTATSGAFAFGLLVAWDGTALDVPGTPANAREFGFTGKGGVNQSGHPQVRLMALTAALVDAAFDAVATFSEQRLARRLLASLRPDMLLLTDRNFSRYELWGLARATGATWPGGSGRTWFSSRCRCCPAAPTCRSCRPRRKPSGTDRPGPPAVASSSRPRATPSASSRTPSPSGPGSAFPTPRRSGWSPDCWTTGWPRPASWQ